MFRCVCCLLAAAAAACLLLLLLLLPEVRFKFNFSGVMHPTKNSPCERHHAGTLTDGTEFDSSYKRGEPTTFAPNQVIPGPDTLHAAQWHRHSMAL